jgi:ribonucleoside-triphosphate reductase (thioredoxin)
MLPTPYQEFIHLSRYARWNNDLGRRETWEETANRYFDFFVPYLNENHSASLNTDFITRGGENTEVDLLRNAILNLDIMPSMRCLMTAGRALARDHVAGYNCAYRPIDDVRAFDEILFVLMCSTGVGFSVERQYVNQLPVVPERDSKRGWAEGYRELLGLLYAGRIPSWDVTKVRPKGARLKTMGGRASGPDPLVDLFKFTICIFKNAEGRRLTSLECHDLVCKIGECVVVGGVRRSALLSLSNLSDQRMRDAKSGEWWVLEPQRALSNNSVAYTEKPETGQFMSEWLSLYQSKAGERGVYNREAARQQTIKSGRRKGYTGNGTDRQPIDFGTNPCGEIVLRPKQFCNLSTIIVRREDEVDTLENKIKLATILGTWQSTLTNFRYLTRKWRENCEEERLLGVSMTGIMTNNLLNNTNKHLPDLLEHLKNVAVEANKEWADRLGIPQSTAITCIKPEGTSSQLVGSPCSGIHPAYAPFYVRRVRQDKKDPLTQLMIDQNVPHEQDVINSENIVFEFPMECPSDTVMRDDMSAVQQLKHWRVFRNHWCEHNPSVTIYVRENEWPGVGGWVWDNFGVTSGLTFLPHSNHTYRQAPYEEINESQFHDKEAAMPELDWSKLGEYEKEDNTTGNRELSCTAGACEI